MKKFVHNRIAQLIKEKEQQEHQGFHFIPDRDFYKAIDIGQKRWGFLLRNEQPATTSELLSIALYFNFKLTEVLELEQANEPSS